MRRLLLSYCCCSKKKKCDRRGGGDDNNNDDGNNQKQQQQQSCSSKKTCSSCSECSNRRRHHHHHHHHHHQYIKTCKGDGNNNNKITTTSFITEEQENVDIFHDDTKTWMSKIDDSTLLSQLVLPGSHDAGMSEAHDVVPSIGKSKVIKLTQTQSLPILEQLMAGSRYLDLRVDLIDSSGKSKSKSKPKSKRRSGGTSSSSSSSDNNYNGSQQQEEQLLELVTFHRNSQKFGMDGQSLKGIFDQLRKFLLTQPSETVLLKFSHIGGGIDFDSNETKMKLANFLLSNYKDMLIFTTSQEDPTVDLLKLPLGLLRGKLLVIMDYDEFINPAQGRFRYRDYLNHGRTNIRVYDHYSNTDSLSQMSNDQISKWKQQSMSQQQQQESSSSDTDSSSSMFLLSWTLTPQGLLSKSIKKLAQEANSTLDKTLQSLIIQQNWVPPNIVYVDYITPQLGQLIIQYNKFKN